MNNDKQVKIGAVLSYVILFVSNAISLIYTPFLIRFLGQSEYGLYSIMSNFIAYLNLLELGLGNAMIIFMSKSIVNDSKEQQAKHIGSFLKIYTFLGFLALVLGIIMLFLINPLFAHSMSTLELFKAKIMFGILLVPMVLSFPLGVFNSLITINEKYVFQKVLNLIRILIVPSIMLPLLLSGYKSISLVLVTSIVSVLIYITNYIYCKKELHLKVIFDKIDKKIFKKIFGYSVFIFIAMIVEKVNNSIDYILLGSLSGTIAVSIYQLGAQFNTIYISFSTSISSVMLPKISKIADQQDSDKRLTELFIKVGRIQFIILALIMSGFVIFGREFIWLWVGSDYNYSYFVALVLMLPYTIPLIQNLGITILQAKNLHKFRSICYAIIAVINLIISIILIKSIGVIGACIGTAFSIIVGNFLIMNIYYKKKCGLDILLFWKNIFRLSIGLIIPVIIGIISNLLFFKYNLLVLIIKIIIYTVVYLISMYFVGMNDYEKSAIKKIFYKIFKRGKNDNNK